MSGFIKIRQWYPGYKEADENDVRLISIDSIEEVAPYSSAKMENTPKSILMFKNNGDVYVRDTVEEIEHAIKMAGGVVVDASNEKSNPESVISEDNA